MSDPAFNTGVLDQYSDLFQKKPHHSAANGAVPGAIPHPANMQNDRILRAARGERVDRPPIWVMRQAGRYLPQYHKAKGNRDFFECCQNPDVASEITVQPIDEYSDYIDAAIIFSDILVVPQALGMECIMLERGDPRGSPGPHFTHPLRSPEEQQYKDIIAKEVDVVAELGYVFDAIKATKVKLKGRVPLIGFCGAPWTLLCYMVEGGGSKLFREIKIWIYTYPEESKKLLQKMAEVCVDYLAKQVAAGAQMVQVFDSWAGELSPASFKEFSMPYLTYIADHLPDRLKKDGLPQVPMIVFAKGAWYALEALCASNYNVVGLDWLHDPKEAFDIGCRTGTVIQGNMDPAVLYGDKAAITAAVQNLVKGFDGGKQGWICNLGHGVTPFVDKEKLRFFFQEVHRISATYR